MQRTKLTDAFMAFLVVVGGVQFLYCLVVGNYVSSCFFGWLGFGMACMREGECGRVVEGAYGEWDGRGPGGVRVSF